MSLTAEQCRALAMLTNAGLDGASQASLMARGFCVSMIAGLIKRGLATLTREKARVGSRLLDVSKVRITAAGRDALATKGLMFCSARGCPYEPTFLPLPGDESRYRQISHRRGEA